MIINPYQVQSPYVGPLDSIPSLIGAYGLRRLLSAYHGPLIQIRPSPYTAGDTPLDITGTPSIDQAAILAYLTSYSKTAANITKFYDQTGNGRDLVPRADTYVDADAWQIATGSTINVFNTKPFAEIRTATSGMYADTGSDLSSTTLWGGTVSCTTNSSTGNRFMGISNTSKSTSDAGATSRAILMIREGASTNNLINWFRNAGSGNYVTTNSHGQRNAIATRFDGTNGQIWTRYATASKASSGTFTIRYLLAFSDNANGGSAMCSSGGNKGTFTEMFWSTGSPSDATVNAVISEQRTYYGI